MAKEIWINNDDFGPICEWENEGGPPVDATYIVLDPHEPQTTDTEAQSATA
jgi:hypothetical protein